MKYKLPHFKEIDLTQLEEYYNVEIEQKGQKIRIDLNFERKAIEIILLTQALCKYLKKAYLKGIKF